MQLACLFIDRLSVKAEIQRNPSLAQQPVVIAQSTGSQRVVLDASEHAEGIQPGMLLSEALGQCKGAVLVEPDLVHYRSIFENMLDSIEALGADVEEESLGCATVQVSGLELLHGDQERLSDALLAAIPGVFAPRIGLGPSKFVASAAAYQSKPGQVGSAPSDLQPFLGPLPVELLPVSWHTLSRLHSFGLKSLRQLSYMSIGALQAQFGREGKLMGELARGIDSRPFLPRGHQEIATVSLAFTDPVSTTEIMLTAVKSLLTLIFNQESMHGRFARVCTLDGIVFRAPPWHRRMVFKESLGDCTKAFSVVRHALENSPPPGSLEELSLTLSSLTGEGGHQESLFSNVRRDENLKEALHQLRARLGIQPPIYHVREMEPWSRLPERRQVLVPFSP